MLLTAEQSKSVAFGISKGSSSSSRRSLASFVRPSSSSLTTCPAALYSNQRKNFYYLNRYRGGSNQQQQRNLMSTTTGTITSTTALNAAVAQTETTQPTEVFRKDYQPLPFTVSKAQLSFDIRDRKTTVTTKLTLQENPMATASHYSDDKKALVLDGDESCVKLLSIQCNGKELVPDKDYTLQPGKLILLNPSSGDVLETTVELVPEDNTQLSGLYYSDPMYCTQCEAEGFRRITYYPDRPDNMAVFDRVRIEASKDEYPILLSNGNMLEQGAVDSNGDRHYAVFSDPFPKPR